MTGAPAMTNGKLVAEPEVIEMFGLAEKSRGAQRKAIDRMWVRAQAISRDRKQPPLKRVNLGPQSRHSYSVEVVERWIELLEEVD